MNVIFTIRYFYPFIGGTEKQALTLASHLVAKGISVTILTSRFHRHWKRSEVMERVRVVRLCSPRIKVAGALIYLACMAGYLISHRKRYSLIHTFQISYTSFLSILLARVLRKPALLKLASSGSGGDIERSNNTLWGKLFLYAAKKASRIITVSTAVEQELLAEQVRPSLISRIANGVDLTHYGGCMDKPDVRKKLNLPEKNTIIYTGRLSAEKGVDFLIRSFSKMEKRQPLQLVIIADGPERKALLTLIARHNLEDSVLLFPSAADVAPYLSAADVFVLPSRFEGLSNALLEGMASALPVISTRVGGSTDIIKDGVNGLLVDSDNEGQLINAMRMVLEDRQLATLLGVNARKTVEAHHDMGMIADSYLAVYKSLQKGEGDCVIAREAHKSRV